MIRYTTTLSKKSLILVLTLSLTYWPLSALTDHLSAEQIQPATETFEDISTQSAQDQLTSEQVPLWRSTLHWYIAASGMIMQAASKTLGYMFPKDMAQALGLRSMNNPELLQSVRTITTEFGVNPDTLTIAHGAIGESPAAAFGRDTMIIDEQACKKFSPEELRFVVGHELTHLQKKDPLYQGLLALCLPFVVHFGLKAWDAAFKKTISTIKKTFSVTKEGAIDQTLTKLQHINSWLSTFCVTKAVVAMQLFTAYSRYCEKRADVTSIARLKSADGAVKSFERFQEKMKTMREEHFLNKLFITPEGDVRLDSLHPPLSERIAYTQELAATS